MTSERLNGGPAFARNERLDPIEKIILRSMNEGVITVECDGRINTVNASALRILGLEEPDMVGKGFDEVFPEENEALLRIFSNVVHEGLHIHHDEILYNRPDDQSVDLAVASSYLDTDACEPGLENVVIVFRDITAFKAIERARRKAVDHLSHELKTPVSIIKASVETLDKHHLENEKTKKILGRIGRNLERLTQIQAIVEQILYPPSFRPASFPLPARTEEILNDIRKRSGHRSVSLVSQIEDIQTESIDPNVYHIILDTLVKNAIENTPDNGEIRVSLERVDSSIRLQVADSGMGIPVSDMPFIFDGFHHTQRTEDYSSRKPYDFNAGGKGLELLRLKVLSEAYPFDLTFESERCNRLPNRDSHCPGDTSKCFQGEEVECNRSGGTVFTVLFT